MEKPMKTQINRRAALVGAIAAVSVVLPSISAFANQYGEAELANTIAELKALERRIKLEGKEVDKLEIAILATLPPMPHELLQTIAMRPHNEGQTLPIAFKKCKPSNERYGWSHEELQTILVNGKYEVAVRMETDQVKDLLDCDMAIACKSVKMSPETKATITRLLKQRKTYDSMREAALTNHQRRQEAWEGLLRREDDLLTTIIEWPVNSVHGLATKAKAISESQTCMGQFEMQEIVCREFLSDIARLAKAA